MMGAKDAAGSRHEFFHESLLLPGKCFTAVCHVYPRDQCLTTFAFVCAFSYACSTGYPRTTCLVPQLTCLWRCVSAYDMARDSDYARALLF